MSRRNRAASTSNPRVAKATTPVPRRAKTASQSETKTAPAPRSLRLVHWAVPLLLIGIGWVAYYNSFRGVFIFDDAIRIVDNALIRQPAQHWRALVQGLRPVLQLTIALNYAIGGLNPWGYHL